MTACNRNEKELPRAWTYRMPLTQSLKVDSRRDLVQDGFWILEENYQVLRVGENTRSKVSIETSAAGLMRGQFLVHSCGAFRFLGHHGCVEPFVMQMILALACVALSIDLEWGINQALRTVADSFEL